MVGGVCKRADGDALVGDAGRFGGGDEWNSRVGSRQQMTGGVEVKAGYARCV